MKAEDVPVMTPVLKTRDGDFCYPETLWFYPGFQFKTPLSEETWVVSASGPEGGARIEIAWVKDGELKRENLPRPVIEAWHKRNHGPR